MKVLDLFSGIGGFAIGLEKAGMETVAFCEREPFCQAVLRKHWPKVPIYDDIKTLTANRLASDGITVDVICGGFPCQDISISGQGKGLAGERSGLWREYARLVSELRPRYAIVENVSALLFRGLGDVLGDLASLGYDAEWHCIPASAVGAPHRRDRIWVVAYPGGARGAVGLSKPQQRQEGRPEVFNDGRNRLNGRARQGFWATEPNVGRVVNGVPARSHRLKALGNAVVPQIPEIIGRAIIDHEQPNHH